VLFAQPPQRLQRPFICNVATSNELRISLNQVRDSSQISDSCFFPRSEWHPNGTPMLALPCLPPGGWLSATRALTESTGGCRPPPGFSLLPIPVLGHSAGTTPLRTQKCVALLRETLAADALWSNFLSWTQPPYWNARFKCFIRTLKGVEQGSKNIRTYSTHTHTTWYHFQSVDLLFVAFCLSAMSLVRHERGCIPCFNCSSAGAQGLTAWSWGTSPGSQSILNGLTFQAPER